MSELIPNNFKQLHFYLIHIFKFRIEVDLNFERFGYFRINAEGVCVYFDRHHFSNQTVVRFRKQSNLLTN